MIKPVQQQLTFKTGETTCAYEYGKFCPFAKSRQFNTVFFCGYFDKILTEENGMLMRTEKCLTEFSY